MVDIVLIQILLGKDRNMEIPFVGGAYTGKSSNENTQECINLFPIIDNREGKNQTFLYGTPGLLKFSTLTVDQDTTSRGSWVFGSVMYTVYGKDVFSVTTNGVATNIGEITTISGDVFFADNGKEVILVDGTNKGYLITSGSLVVIVDTDFPVSTSVAFQDGFFVVTSVNGSIYKSGLYDGTSWDASEVAFLEANPDGTVGVVSSSGDLWIFGEKVSEVFYNSGNVDFPFTPISGAILELGAVSAACIVKINEVIYWLSNEGRVVRNRGYQYDTVSTIHVDYQISTYEVTSDVKAFTYTMQGHIFYVLTFPTEGKTWVYDVTTDYWHEWQSYFVTVDGTPWGRHRANSCVKFGGKYIVGDYENGLLYELQYDTYTDNLNVIRRIRTSQIVNKERYNIIWKRVEIDFETGVGLTGGVQGENPQVALQWSDDGGHTWSNEHWKGFGKIGKYSTKVVWKRLGVSKNRVLRVIISDPVKVVMIGAYVELEECTT